MKTKDQFQRETQNFMTRDVEIAKAKAAYYNAIGVEGDTIVPAQFGDLWCVMLNDSFNFTQELGIDGATP